MGKTMSMTGKAVGATFLIGVLVLGACLFSESARTYYPRAKGAC